MIRRRAIVSTIALAGLASPAGVRSQSRGKPVRIGMLGGSPAGAFGGDLKMTFVAALRELGWIEGENISFEFRWAEQDASRYPRLVAELLALNVDVIVSLGGVTSTSAAMRSTSAVPIVFINSADPVKFGLVTSLARPGGNVTGVAIPPLDWGKFLELARDAIPGIARVALLANPTNATYADYIAQNEVSAKRLGLALQVVPMSRADELVDALSAMKRGRAEALVFGPDGLYFSLAREIIERAGTNRLPVIAPFLFTPELGAFAAFGADPKRAMRRGAVYVDRILRGATPAELPVEQPDRFDLIINLKTAAALGIAVPQSVVLRASKVIE